MTLKVKRSLTKKEEDTVNKVNRHIKVATADDEFNKALYEEIRLEEEAFNEWVRENNKRIREKNRK